MGYSLGPHDERRPYDAGLQLALELLEDLLRRIAEAVGKAYAKGRRTWPRRCWTERVRGEAPGLLPPAATSAASLDGSTAASSSTA